MGIGSAMDKGVLRQDEKCLSQFFTISILVYYFIIFQSSKGPVMSPTLKICHDIEQKPYQTSLKPIFGVFWVPDPSLIPTAMYVQNILFFVTGRCIFDYCHCIQN